MANFYELAPNSELQTAVRLTFCLDLINKNVLVSKAHVRNRLED